MKFNLCLLGLLCGATASSASTLATTNPSPLSDKLLSRILTRSNTNSYPHRHLQTQGESCSNAPFLWQIQNKKDETVAFGVGTLHMPRDLALTNTAWQSLVDATADSCAVYGELDLTDSSILQQIETSCTVVNPESLVYIADIPDQELQDEYRAVLLEISLEYAPEAAASIVAEELAATVTLPQILQMVAAWNTPGYKDAFFESIFFSGESDFLDLDLLELGRPSESLETVEENCNLLEAFETTKDDFLANFDKEQLQIALNASYTPLIEAYRCGEVDLILEVLAPDIEQAQNSAAEAAFLDALLDDRNVVMAGRMVNIMDSATTQRPLFAVGLAHWIQGDNSFEILLEKEGYTLQRVDGIYDPELLPELTDAVCGDAYDGEGSTMGTGSGGSSSAVETNSSGRQDFKAKNIPFFISGVTVAVSLLAGFL